jgi:competence protein ComEA
MIASKKIFSLFLSLLFMIFLTVPALAADDAKKININTATVKELTSLKRVGPKLAEKIVEYRKAHGNFAKPEDITKVSGVGKKVFEDNKDKITIGQ